VTVVQEEPIAGVNGPLFVPNRAGVYQDDVGCAVTIKVCGDNSASHCLGHPFVGGSSRHVLKTYAARVGRVAKINFR